MADQPKRQRGRPKKQIIVEVPKNKGGRPKKLSIAEKEQRAIDEQHKKDNPPPKPPRVGKPSKFIPFEAAREIVQAELLHSRAAYEHWFAREKPKEIPRFPYRVYKEWVSWNDFLGTNNEFSNGAKAWRPFLEAIHYVHSLQLKSQKDWLEFCRDDSNNVPEDIPRRPDVVYDKWVSWNHWLGNKPVEAIQAKVEALTTSVYYIIHETGVPENVLTYGVDTVGMSSLKERWDREPYNIIKFFRYEPDKANEIRAIIEGLSSPYLGEDNQRITPNVWQIVERLQLLLVAVRPNVG